MALIRLPEPDTAVVQPHWMAFFSSYKEYIQGNYFDTADKIKKLDILKPGHAGIEIAMSGFGTLGKAISELGYKVISIDIDSPAVELGINLHGSVPGLSIEKADVYDLKRYKDMGFAISSGSLHHFDDLNLAMKEIYRTLAPGSPFYFEDANREYIGNLSQPELMSEGFKGLNIGDFVYETWSKYPDKLISSLGNGFVLPKGAVNENVWLPELVEKSLVIRCLSYAAAWTYDELNMALCESGFNEIHWLSKTGENLEGYAIK